MGWKWKWVVLFEYRRGRRKEGVCGGEEKRRVDQKSDQGSRTVENYCSQGRIETIGWELGAAKSTEASEAREKVEEGVSEESQGSEGSSASEACQESQERDELTLFQQTYLNFKRYKLKNKCQSKFHYQKATKWSS